MIDRLVLKGKKQGILACQPLTEEEYAAPLRQSYEAAYHLLATADSGALAAFANALEQWPDDPLLRVHYQRLRAGQSGETIYFTDK